MKLAVIYDSKTNNTAAVAGYMAEAMNSLEGVEAKTFLYSEVDTEFVKECKGVVFGCPTLYLDGEKCRRSEFGRKIRRCICYRTVHPWRC